MPYKGRHPHIRITQKAYDKLKRHVDAEKRKGLRSSGTAFASALILSLPEPMEPIKKSAHSKTK